jgi:hypothetical protein
METNKKKKKKKMAVKRVALIAGEMCPQDSLLLFDTAARPHPLAEQVNTVFFVITVMIIDSMLAGLEQQSKSCNCQVIWRTNKPIDGRTARSLHSLLTGQQSNGGQSGSK